ncbi:MAG: APC family permease [Salinisphaera sp.]|jgi:amino acid transporter|nr:APC family permease [Salinisphaera sp.]
MAGKLKKDAGLLGLLFAGVGGMIGSGWLLGPLNAARDAGPLSIGSWVIAAVVIMLLALVYAELAPMFPRSGGVVHISHISHGVQLGHFWTWILFVAYVSIPPVEAMAVVNYANNYIPGLIHSSGLLTTTGFIASMVLLAVMVGFNFLAIRLVLAINTVATWIKLLTPIGTIILFLMLSHHSENLTITQHVSSTGMFTAISSAGVFFALFGFRQAIDLAGETDNPGRNLPIAVLGTIVIGAAVFILLQYVFVTAIPQDTLAKNGWHGLTFSGISGPFAGLAMIFGASWWATVLYVDAIISPGVCGFIWSTSGSRIIMAGGESETMPSFVAWVNNNGTPWMALIVVYVVGAIFFLPLPSWQKMVSYASAATVLSYGIGPIVLLKMRQAVPDSKLRSFRLPMPYVIAPLAFIASNFVIFWAGFGTNNFMFLLLLGVFILFAIYFTFVKRGVNAGINWKSMGWLFPYFGGMWLLSYLGPKPMGGIGLLEVYVDMAIIIVFSLAIMWLALKVAVSPESALFYYENTVLADDDPETSPEAA